MIYSKRKQLEEEYREWIKDRGVDCAFNVITFLSSKGLLKEDELAEIGELNTDKDMFFL